MKLFLTDQIKNIDTYTIEHEPVSSVELMERAAEAFVEKFNTKFSGYRKVVVFAGPGNNGGDALAIARLLHLMDNMVEIFLFNPFGKLSSDCEVNKKRLFSLPKVNFTEIRGEFVPPVLKSKDIVIDGLFGSGLNKPLAGGFASVVQYINAHKATVVSIDIPSGLFGEDNTGNPPEHIIRANYTFTFQFPKLSFLFPESEEFTGEWEVLDIGLHPKALSDTPTSFYLTEREDIRKILKKRSRFANKGNFGHSLLVAGSLGKMGAAVLSATACMRSGAGLLTAHIPQRGNDILQQAIPEVMTSIDVDSSLISDIPDPGDYTAIGIGPGIGTENPTKETLEKFLKQPSLPPLVLDADALNLLSKNRKLLEFLPENSVLTPHPKEMDRLLGENPASSYERLEKTRQFAAKYKVYVVLKGAFTAICMPDESCYFNPTGNAGMSTAGSGDVLTGVILGLLSQSYEPACAALAGVFVHGLSGDFALEENSEESLLSGDIIRYLGYAFKEIKLPL